MSMGIRAAEHGRGRTEAEREGSCERSRRSQHCRLPSARPRKSTPSRVGLHAAAVYLSGAERAVKIGAVVPTRHRWKLQSPVEQHMHEVHARALKPHEISMQLISSTHARMCARRRTGA